MNNIKKIGKKSFKSTNGITVKWQRSERNVKLDRTFWLEGI